MKLVSQVAFLAAAFLMTGVIEGAAIRGIVLLEGAVPPPREILPTVDSHVCGSGYKVSPVVVGKGGGIENAVVYLLDAATQEPFQPKGPSVVDQKRCRFTPDLVIVPAGGAVTIKNSDSVTHNVHSSGESHRGINKFQPVGADIELPVPRPGIVRVKCDIHHWMEMYIVAASHRFYTTTDESGEFVFQGIQPGTYTLEVWHPELAPSRQKVTVGAEAVVPVQLRMSQ